MKLEFPLQIKHANRLLCALLLVEAVFGLLYYLDFRNGAPSVIYHQLISLDLEANIPTWFSLVQLFMIGLIPILLACSAHYKAPPSRGGLVLFGSGFIYLSLDEGAVIHEKMTYTFHNNPLVPYFDGVHGIWITVYMGVLILVLLVLGRDLWAIARKFPKESAVFFLGMLIYLTGSAGAETLTFFFLDKSDQAMYNLEVIIEEFLEMAGASVLLYSVLCAAIKKSESLQATG